MTAGAEIRVMSACVVQGVPGLPTAESAMHHCLSLSVLGSLQQISSAQRTLNIHYHRPYSTNLDVFHFFCVIRKYGPDDAFSTNFGLSKIVFIFLFRSAGASTEQTDKRRDAIKLPLDRPIMQCN